MSVNTAPSPKSSGLSIDLWAVIVAFLFAAFVRTGVLKHIPW
jgi:hypothetical protein